MASTYLVTGANRGIGLEFARQLTFRGDRVIATARDPEKAADLKATGATVWPLDVADAASIASLSKRVAETPIDVLINNAGVSSASKSITTLDGEELARVFRVNSTGPMLVAKAVLQALKSGQRKTVLSITSQLGSIANNTGGSSYAYRASKAALNMLNRSLAAELKGDGFTCVVAHPGWVQTDMGGKEAPLAPQESVRALVVLLDRLTTADTGKFFNYDGKELPW
jgi:NAD(P)-dependent dehydrogenase (short-subunit alcohol dehydrogenase family)